MQTAPLDFRLATRADEELLIALMRDFYAEDKIEFDDARVRRGVDALLADPRNGEVLLWLDEAAAVVGYAVIAMGFSLEQGGHFMLLDELYLSHRARCSQMASARLPRPRPWQAGTGHLRTARAGAWGQPAAVGGQPSQRTGAPPVPGQRLHR
jgi:hypothetical protein